METNRFMTWIFRKFMCQRGEVATDIDADAFQDAVYSADIDDEDYVPPTDDDDQTDDNDDSNDDDSTDDSQDDEPEEDPKITELSTKLEEAQKEINRLGYALRKSKPEDKKEETPFTKAELMKLYKEHANDPDVVFQIFEEMTKQGKVDAQAAAEKSADIKNKQSQIDPLVNTLYPDAKKEGSELHGGIQEAVEWAHLEGHPFADTLGLALLFLKDMPQTIKKIKEEAKSEFEKTSKKTLEEKAELSRKNKIKEGKLSKTGKNSDQTNAASLTPNQLETAKKMGFTTKEQLARYAKILGKKGENVHEEA